MGVIVIFVRLLISHIILAFSKIITHIKFLIITQIILFFQYRLLQKYIFNYFLYFEFMRVNLFIFSFGNYSQEFFLKHSKDIF